jgi:homeodomain-containing protein
MAIGRLIPMLTLIDDERDTLERWARRPTTAQALAQRTGVTCKLRLTKPTVGKWRRRFLTARRDDWLDEPRLGAPRRISDAYGAQMVTLTLEARPREATRWSIRAITALCRLSQRTVSRFWRAFGLQPHRTKAFKLWSASRFVEKVRISWASTWTRRTARLPCALMRSLRFRPWIARCCRRAWVE